MHSGSSPTRSQSSGEPTVALRALLDLPLRFKVPDAFAAQIDTLASMLSQVKAREEYTAIYRSAVDLVEALVRELDATIEQMQRDGLRQDDPNELRQRLAGAPRKEAEKARSDARTSLQRVHKEWVERTRRQLDHVAAQCTEAGHGALPTEEKTQEGLTLGVAPQWWKEYGGYVTRCCEEWTRNVVEQAEQAYQDGVMAALAPALRHASKRNPSAPERAIQPLPEAKLAAETPTKEAEIPTTAGALMQSVRTNVMAVGIFGTVLAVIVTVAGKAFGEGPSSSSYTMLARGGLILAVLPFSIVSGLKAARTKRATLREKALAAHKAAVVAFVKSELDKGLERHRKALERWLSSRAEAWTFAVDRWWDVNVEPSLAEYDSRAGDAVRDTRLSQAKFSEELAAVRTFRSQLAQNLLFDLRRRHRELTEAPPQPA